MSHKNRWSIVIAAWLWCASPVLADFRDGNGLLQDCSQGNIAFCYGYIDAITDVLQSEPVNGKVSCVPFDATMNQLKDVVVQFLLLNPSVRHAGAQSLVAYAISEAFPCRRR
jgi:hypothetical protein